jgi:glycyl-tRNA synthetase beta chain
LLIEIGTEEIPPSYIEPAIEFLRNCLSESLREARFDFASVRSAATPRRLTLFVESLSPVQRDVEIEVVGPPRQAAYDSNGSPTAAATGFAKGQGVEVSELRIVDTDRGPYVAVTRLDKGRPLTEVLPTIVEQCLSDVGFPKSMWWSEGGYRFARPIRWLVCLYGTETIDLEIAGVSSGRRTYGLRLRSSDPIELENADFESYSNALENAFVVVDVEDRKRMIREGIASKAEEVGGEVIEDEDLLHTNAYLVECPTIIAGRFDRRYLEIPKPVVVTAMKSHQKYFAVQDESGNLLPNFLAVVNAPENKVDLIRAGNERVLEARLEDAEFYWNEDLKTNLEEKVSQLKKVVWLEGLGTLYEKVTRVKDLVSGLAMELKAGETETKTALRAAWLCKADLVTEMVKDGKEFTDLQGTMGMEYALATGEDPAVASAIFEHYLPRFAGDMLPGSLPGIMVSIADKMDTVAGCFTAGITPSGSQDPLGLRRQATSILRIILDKDLTLELSRIIALGREGYENADSETMEKLERFFRNRVQRIFIDRGGRYDIVDAILASRWSDLKDVKARLDALTSSIGHESFEGIVIGAKRVSNILKTDEEKKQPRRDEMTEKMEMELYDRLMEARERVDELSAQGKLGKVAEVLFSLRPTIDRFFDDVMVMHEDADVRARRLGLMNEVRELFISFADFSKIVLEGE